jgi:predicted nuclease of predicted toxin-antitoxin system
LAAAVRLYLDESLSPRIAEQLRRRGIDSVSARDLATLGQSDPDHLARAIAMNRVLVTADPDFLSMAATGLNHPGIVFGAQEDHTIGDWVKGLETLCLVYSADDMIDHVEYL